MEPLPHQDPLLVEAVLRLARAAASLPAKNPFHPPRAWVVGGFVRDMLLGITSKDVDVEVFGVECDELETLLKKTFPNVDTVGRSFGTLKVFLGDGKDLDVSVPRRESKTGPGHRGFVIEGDPWMSLEDAARRRDFTINAISYDPLADEWSDPFGGRKDLARKTLRLVDPKTFIEDPLRVYRGIQFAARFDLTIEKKTFETMRKMVEDGSLDELSPERITEEIRKLLLNAETPSVGLSLMRELGIIKKYYPELAPLADTPQEPEWHPEGDVWIHTLMVVDAAAGIIRQPEHGFSETEKLQVMLGALCHDLGKPATTAMGEKEGVPRIRSLGHEAAGEEPTRSLLKKWTFGEAALDGALAGTLRHLQPGMVWFALQRGKLTGEQYANAVRKLVKRIHPVSWRVLLAISEADFRGRTLPEARGPYEAGEKFAATVREYAFDEAPVKPLLQGRDLMELGVQAGPEMGKMIRAIEDARDRGEIKTREEALEFAKRRLK